MRKYPLNGPMIVIMTLAANAASAHDKALEKRILEAMNNNIEDFRPVLEDESDWIRTLIHTEADGLLQSATRPDTEAMAGVLHEDLTLNGPEGLIGHWIEQWVHDAEAAKQWIDDALESIEKEKEKVKAKKGGAKS